MKKNLLVLFLILFGSFSIAQGLVQSSKVSLTKKPFVSKEDKIVLTPTNSSKILSGKLLSNVNQKNAVYKQNVAMALNPELIEVPTEIVAVYMESFPTSAEITQLEAENIKCYTDCWIPPLSNHPMGFFLAAVPVNKLDKALSFTFIKKMDTAEYQNVPHNNSAASAINANDMWDLGYDGTGVKVAVLDSGIDTSYAGTELPATFEKRDYSNYPTSTDPDVANITSGHGTHVTGSVLGRGYYSEGRADEGNGSGAFKGMAPGADLVFLKIGGDASSGASSNGMIGAMVAAVNTYNADILTMSYGGWYAYHDGSSSTEQTVDWVYEQGKPFFLSAGNSGADNAHFSGSVAAEDSTDFIQVNAYAYNGNDPTVSFNLVWVDGIGTTDTLKLKYYDSSMNEYPADSLFYYGITESPRGTQSEYSLYDNLLPEGIYYVKVINKSASTHDFHIYFDDWGYGYSEFENADPEYTIGQPSSADHGFAVGAYVSRYFWYAINGSAYWYGYSPNGILAPFSSRGPRVNGGVTKPNITAPGSAIISLRDQDVYTSATTGWIDNDGVLGDGDMNYYIMQGTSMACPITAGAAALLLQKEPAATPQNIYDAIEATGSTNAYTGALPNNDWGNGILDVLAASNSSLLPVELASFSAVVNSQKVQLSWSTATEVNNYGFDVERKAVSDEAGGWEKIGFVAGAGNSNSSLSYSFFDKAPVSGKSLYRLRQVDIDGSASYSDEIEVNLTLPVEFNLSQNYPNPFNPATVIKFSIPEKSSVKLNIFNALGQQVASLLNKEMEAGNHSVKFDASRLTSGVYFYRLETNTGNLAVKKMLLIK